MQTPVYPGTIPALVAAKGDIDEQIVAAGELRQGRKPSMLAMLSGAALLEVWRPRRSKTLPRRFVLAVTAERVVAYKCLGGGEDGDYSLWVRGGVAAEFPRSSVAMADEGTLLIDGEPIPVFCPNMTNGGDDDTKGLIALLAGV